MQHFSQQKFRNKRISFNVKCREENFSEKNLRTAKDDVISLDSMLIS